MNILISGAGIGGLTTALCLLKAGHHVQIIEQAAVFSEIGAGIQCGANALHVFDYLGLLPEIETMAVEPQAAEFRTHQSGDLLYKIPFGESYRQQYNAPYLHIHRADLQTILLDACLRTAPDCVQMNAQLVSYTENESNVVVKLQNRQTLSADCLIACDGIKSTVRQQLLCETSIINTGNVAWRGTIPASKLPDSFMDSVVTNFVGPRQHMVIYYLRQRQLLNFVGVVENNDIPQAGQVWVEQAPWTELASDFADWHPIVQTLLQAVDKQQCYRWALHRHAPITNWSSNRVTLLGDAAHATLPFMASGAAMAIEDARILDRSFAQSENVESALQCYQRNRIERTAKVQRRSSQAGKLYHMPNAFLLKMAFKALALRPTKADSFLADYNANTIPLI